MSEVLKTVDVVTKSGTRLRINESEFDPKKHKRVEAAADPKATKTTDAAKTDAKPTDTEDEFTPEAIDKMDTAEIDGLLAAHGLELKGSLKDKREALKEVMFVNTDDE